MENGILEVDLEDKGCEVTKQDVVSVAGTEGLEGSQSNQYEGGDSNKS